MSMKKIFSFFAVALLSMSAMAGTVVFTAADFKGGAASPGAHLEAVKSGVTVSTENGYKADDHIRVFGGGTYTLEFSSEIKMTKIAFEWAATGNKYEGPATETPNATEYTVTATKQMRIAKITVTVDGEVEGEEGEEGEIQDSYDVTFTTAEVYNYFDFMTDDAEDITVYLSGDEEYPYFFQMDMLVKNGTGLGKQLPKGTYKIDESFAVGTVLVGFEDEEYYEPYGAWFIDMNAFVMLPLTAGTVTVGDKSITIDGEYEDELGKVTIKASYKGDLTIEEGLFEDDEAVENVDAEVKVMKSIENGQLIIRRGENSYNVMGVAM